MSGGFLIEKHGVAAAWETTLRMVRGRAVAKSTHLQVAERNLPSDIAVVRAKRVPCGAVRKKNTPVGRLGEGSYPDHMERFDPNILCRL